MSVMFFHGTVKDDFDARWKSRHLVKQFMEHKVSSDASHWYEPRVAATCRYM